MARMCAARRGIVFGAPVGVLIHDDAQVVNPHRAKRYGEPEGLAARVRAL